MQVTVDPRMLEKILQAEQQTIKLIKELLERQSNIEAKIDEQQEQITAILNKLSTEETEVITKSGKGKKKKTEEFYQVNILY